MKATRKQDKHRSKENDRAFARVADAVDSSFNRVPIGYAVSVVQEQHGVNVCMAVTYNDARAGAGHALGYASIDCWADGELEHRVEYALRDMAEKVTKSARS